MTAARRLCPSGGGGQVTTGGGRREATAFAPTTGERGWDA